MMPNNTESSKWPAPLRTLDSRLADVVREYVKDTDDPPGIAAVHTRVVARMGQAGPRSSRRLLLAATGVAATAICAATAFAVYHRDAALSAQPTHAAGAGVTEALLPTIPPAPTPSLAPPGTASIRLGELPSVLPAGRVDLLGQASAVLSTDGRASGRAQDGKTEIVLARGNLELHVLPRAPGQTFTVVAGLYKFTVMGTSFTVSQTRSRLELVVSEGRVSVSRGSKLLATVGAGGTWAVALNSVASSGLRQAEVRGQTREASTPAARAPGFVHDRECGQLAAGKNAREALLCYEEQAVQPGLAGETAQYELARLLRDTFASPERALAAFKDQRARFPKGALRTEADLSIIELLPRLGRHAEAMGEIEQFLAAHPKSQRRGELHLMRGNIFREVLHDLNRAEREYASAAESGGRVGDDSRFMRAVCLETLGRVEEAGKAFQDYLRQDGTAHREEAERRLEHLRP